MIDASSAVDAAYEDPLAFAQVPVWYLGPLAQVAGRHVETSIGDLHPAQTIGIVGLGSYSYVVAHAAAAVAAVEAFAPAVHAGFLD